MNYSSKVYYKVRWQLLQSATGVFITFRHNLLLQSATTILLQSVTSIITKCDRYYKVRRFYYKVRQVLQSVTIITKCDRTTSNLYPTTLLNFPAKRLNDYPPKRLIGQVSSYQAYAIWTSTVFHASSILGHASLNQAYLP